MENGLCVEAFCDPVPLGLLACKPAHLPTYLPAQLPPCLHPGIRKPDSLWNKRQGNAG